MTKYKFLDVDIETLDTDIDVIADMLPKVGREKWRKRNKHLATKPIPKEVFPTLANLMIEDNIRFVLHEEASRFVQLEVRCACRHSRVRSREAATVRGFRRSAEGHGEGCRGRGERNAATNLSPFSFVEGIAYACGDRWANSPYLLLLSL